METIKINSGEEVTLSVKISSDAIVGSNVSLNEKIVKKSTAYSFTVALGKIDDIHVEEVHGNKVKVISNFIVQGGNIDDIMNTSHVDITITSLSTSKTLKAKNVKIDSSMFMSHQTIILEKE